MYERPGVGTRLVVLVTSPQMVWATISAGWGSLARATISILDGPRGAVRHGNQASAHPARTIE